MASIGYTLGFAATSFTPAFPARAPDGTAAAPSYSFTHSPTTGMFSPAVNALGFSTNGTLALTLSSAQLGTAAGAWRFPAGTALLPAVSLNGVIDGLFQVSAGVIGLTGAATEVARFSATLAQIPAAAAVVWNGRTHLTSTADGTLVVSQTTSVGSERIILGNNSGNGVLLLHAGNTFTVQTGAGAAGITESGLFQGGGFSTPSAPAFSNNQGSSNTGLYMTTGQTAGISVNGLTAMVWDATQNIIISGTGGALGANNSASVNIRSVTALTTLSLVSATTPLVTIPAGALLLLVTARVTTAITAVLSTTWSLGTGAIANDFGSGLAFAAGTVVKGTDYVGFTGSQMYPSATAINAVLNSDAATAGVIRTVAYYIDVIPPTA